MAAECCDNIDHPYNAQCPCACHDGPHDEAAFAADMDQANERMGVEIVRLRARLAAVRAELARRQKCAAEARAAGRVCDYCEDFIPGIEAALDAPHGEDDPCNT